MFDIVLSPRSHWGWWATTASARGTSARAMNILRAVQKPWIHECIWVHLLKPFHLTQEKG